MNYVKTVIHSLILIGLLMSVAVSAGSLYPVKNKSKWGYVNKSGTMIIQPRFQSAGYFSEDHAKVKLNDKIGFIDRNGNVIIQPQFDDAYAFSEGLAAVKTGKLSWGYINTSGEFAIEPQQTLITYPFRHGIAFVRKTSGALPMNREGKRAFQPERSLKLAFPYVNRYTIAWSGKKWVLLDQQGQIHDEQNEDTPLEKVIVAWSTDATHTPIQNHVEPFYPVKIEGQWGFINQRLEMIIEPRFNSARPFSENLAAVKTENSLWTYVDRFGKRAFKQDFSAAHSFYRGLAGVKKDGKWGLIDAAGRWQVQPQFDGIAPPLITTEAAFTAPK